VKDGGPAGKPASAPAGYLAASVGLPGGRLLEGGRIRQAERGEAAYGKRRAEMAAGEPMASGRMPAGTEAIRSIGKGKRGKGQARRQRLEDLGHARGQPQDQAGGALN
jgi:hypothetical protein